MNDYRQSLFCRSFFVFAHTGLAFSHTKKGSYSGDNYANGHIVDLVLPFPDSICTEYECDQAVHGLHGQVGRSYGQYA